MTKKLFIFCYSMSLLFFNYDLSAIAQEYFRCDDETEDIHPPPTPNSNILIQIKEPTPGLLIVEGEGGLTLVNPETNDSITIENEKRDNISWFFQITTEKTQLSIVIGEKTFTTNFDFIVESVGYMECSSEEDKSIIQNEKFFLAIENSTPKDINVLITYKGILYRTRNGTQETISMLKILKFFETENPTNNKGNRSNSSVLSILLFPKNLGDFQEEFPLEVIRSFGLR